MSLPFQIEQMLAQLGDGLSGARVYCGTTATTYHCRPDQAKPNPSKVVDGFIFYDVGISMKVNGKKGYQWFIVITLEPSDTYIVRMQIVRGRKSKIYQEIKDVYCDNLQAVVEDVYDRAIKELNQGFINV